ncbi:MAG: hypothetical protein ACLR06_17325 [Christensenellaceae bacterium]
MDGVPLNRELFCLRKWKTLALRSLYSAYKSENGTGERLNYADNFSDVENTDKIKFQPTVDIKSLKITLTSLAAGRSMRLFCPRCAAIRSLLIQMRRLRGISSASCTAAELR